MTFHCIFTDYSSVELTYQNIRSTLLVATCIFLLLTTDIIIDQDLPWGGGGGEGGQDHFQGGRLPPLHPPKNTFLEQLRIYTRTN